MTSDTPLFKRNRLSIIIGGTLLLAGGITGAAPPPAYLASEAEYDYQELLVEMDDDLHELYGETPPDGMRFSDFLDHRESTPS